MINAILRGTNIIKFKRAIKSSNENKYSIKYKKEM